MGCNDFCSHGYACDRLGKTNCPTCNPPKVTMDTQISGTSLLPRRCSSEGCQNEARYLLYTYDGSRVSGRCETHLDGAIESARASDYEFSVKSLPPQREQDEYARGFKDGYKKAIEEIKSAVEGLV